jgi:ribonuclease III
MLLILLLLSSLIISTMFDHQLKSCNYKFSMQDSLNIIDTALDNGLDHNLLAKQNHYQLILSTLNLPFSFSFEGLICHAFVHKSYLKDVEANLLYTTNNERLEFLGDAVLELIATDYLFSTFKDQQEGVLTAIRSYLVNANMLYDVGVNLKLDKLIMLSKGERNSMPDVNPSIIADCFEALIGVMYIEFGLEITKSFIIKHVLHQAKEVLEQELYRDPKTKIQELVQEKYKLTPNYTILETFGKDHQKTFIVGLYIGEHLITKQEGQSKQKAEIVCAKWCLDNFESLNIIDLSSVA